MDPEQLAQVAQQAHPSIEQGLQQLMSYLNNAIVVGTNFTIEQAPIIVTEIFRWAIVNCVLTVFCWTVILGLVVYVMRTGDSWLFPAHKEYGGYNSWSENDRDLVSRTFKLFSSVPFFIMVIVWLVQITNIVYIIVAPRVYLIEEISRLVRARH